MEDRYQGRVQATLEFAFTIEDFDDLVDPHHLYDCCLGSEPSVFVLKKIVPRREEYVKLLFPFFFVFFF